MINGTEVDNYASPYVAGQTSMNMYKYQVLRSGERVTVRLRARAEDYFIHVLLRSLNEDI